MRGLYLYLSNEANDANGDNGVGFVLNHSVTIDNITIKYA